MKMIKFTSAFLFVFLFFGTSFITSDANAHELFNSSELVLGDYTVQIATLPEIPTTGEKSQILLRVYDLEGNEVDHFVMGMRIFYKDVQIDSIPPESYNASHWEMDYVFENPGNHIFRVDLYDAAKDGGTLTYTFNLSTLNPFGYIFFYSIAAGSIGLGIIFAYVYIPKILKSKSKS